MAANIIVEVCGPTLACLFYDIANCHGDQEGFLIGDITTRVTDSISDSQLNYEKEEVIVSIHNCIPAHFIGEFYNGVGYVDEESVKTIVGSKFKNIVGWYRFRRNTTLDAFLRERTIHHNILKMVPTSRKPFFLFGIFTSKKMSNCATHDMDHIFLCCKNKRSFEGIQLSVVNLGDTSQSKYRLNPPLVFDRQRGIYGQLISSLKHSVLDSTGTSPSISHIRNLQSSLQLGLKTLCQQVSESESNIVSLEEDIRKLKECIQNAENNKDSSFAQKKSAMDTKASPSSLNSSIQYSIKTQDSKWTSYNVQPKKSDKINLQQQIDMKSTVAPQLPPNDVSNAENNLRKVTKSHHIPSADFTMHLVNIGEPDNQSKKEDNVNIFTEKGNREKDTIVDERSQTCSRSPT